MNRVLAIALAFALALLGCGGTDGNTDNSGPDDNVQPPAETYKSYVDAAYDVVGDLTLDGSVLCNNVAGCLAELTKKPANANVTLDVQCDGHGFVPKTRPTPENGQTADVDWLGYGDMSVKASGLYLDQWGLEVEINVEERDLDGDGDLERTIYGDDFDCIAVFDENSFEADCGATTIEGWADGVSEGYYLANYKDGSDPFERLLTLVEPYPED